MRSKIKILGFLIAVLSVSFACKSKYNYETVKGDPLKARIYTLDNGLKVYMTVNDETPRIQTYIAVRVGGKNDPAETTGLAHYFEHLMFKGTESFGTQDYESERPILDQIESQFEIYRTVTDENNRLEIYKTIDSLSYEASKYAIPNEYDKLMAAIGAEGTNAYTGFDQTVYVEDIPSNQIENWAKIQSDRFRNNVIRGFHTELETVYEEKNMSLTNDSRKVMEAVFSSLYPNHPYGTQTVLGSQEHLKNPSISKIKEYFRTYYVPNNMAICLSGDFDPDEMIAVIDKYFGDMKPNPNLPKFEFLEESAITTPIVKTIVGREADNVTIAWRTTGAAGEDSEKLNLLNSILYNQKAGLIDLNLLQKQRVLSCYSYYYELSDHGMIIMQARPKGGQSLDEVKELIMEQVAKLKAGDFDDSLLEATINNYKASIMSYTDSNQGRADMFVDAFINGNQWKEIVGMLDKMSKVTKDDIVELANRVLGDDNYAVVYKLEGTDPDETRISKPEITPIYVNRDSSSDFLKEIQSTDVKPINPVFVDFEKDLDKGTAKSDIPVLYVRNPTNGLFQLIYVFETGSNNDPAMGMAFNYLQFLGTSRYTPEEINQEFYKLACSFRVSPSAERSSITLSGLSENMEEAAELLEHLLADAQPNEEALVNMKADIMKNRQDSKLNQRANFNMLRTYAMYGPKSPATNVLSTGEIAAMEPQDLLEKIKNLGKMEHRILYYGPLSKNDLIGKINKFHNVPETLAAVPEVIRYPYLETNENRVLFAEYDAPQIYFAQHSNRGEKYDPANDASETMYNEYFGGGMNSIVFQEMRESRGLAYMASSALLRPGRKENPYTMVAIIATQNDKMGEAIDAFEDIINNMPESEAAFSLAKESLIARMNTERTVKDGILWSYLRAQDMGLDYDNRKDVYESIQYITLSDVKDFQEKWVKGRTYTYCVLGDSSDLDMDKLRSYGPLTRLSREELFGY